MSDELEELGINCQDETILRNDVAASVQASVDKLTSEEQLLLNDTWNKLHEAEKSLFEYKETGAITSGAKQQQNRARLQVLERACTEAAKQLRQVRSQIRTKQHSNATSRFHNLKSDPRSGYVDENHCSNQIDTTNVNNGGSSAIKTHRESSSTENMQIKLESSSFDSKTSAYAKLHLSDAIEEYSGGKILPSAFSVPISVSDVRIRRRRYTDDADDAEFKKRLQMEIENPLHKISQRVAIALKSSVESACQNNLGKDLDETKVLQDVIIIHSDSDDEIDGRNHKKTNPIDSHSSQEIMRTHQNSPSHFSSSEAQAQLDSTIGCSERVKLDNEMSMSKIVYDRLLDYQKEGVHWMINLHYKRTGGILGDEMGLGKTVQVASLLEALHGSNLLLGPVLLVAPLTVLRQWVNEMHSWCPQLRVYLFHDFHKNKIIESQIIERVKNKPAMVVTTYALMRLKCKLLQRANFQYVILDEGHKICNPDATVTLAAKTFLTPHKLVLSGSPIQNTLKELWCLFDFVNPGLLGNMQTFVKEFEEPIRASSATAATPFDLTTAIECAAQLREYISPYFLRRLKKEVKIYLPPKVERVIWCRLTPLQLKSYVEILLSAQAEALMSSLTSQATRWNNPRSARFDRVGSTSMGKKFIKNHYSDLKDNKYSTSRRAEYYSIITKLRSICNHVDILGLKKQILEEGGCMTKISYRSNYPVNLDGSSKLKTIQILLRYWKPQNHRVLIFSQSRMMLDIVENMCNQEGHYYVRIDGATPHLQRMTLIDRFNSDESIFVFLLTTRVGGIGVNLTGADRVVILDPDWNPVTDEQARERAWRIGQRREVHIYRLIVRGTMEEYVLHTQLAKNYVTEKVLSDPRLQRFFATPGVSDKIFYLGSEYANDLPKHLHYLLSHSLLPLDDKNKTKEDISSIINIQPDNEMGPFLKYENTTLTDSPLLQHHLSIKGHEVVSYSLDKLEDSKDYNSSNSANLNENRGLKRSKKEISPDDSRLQINSVKTEDACELTPHLYNDTETLSLPLILRNIGAGMYVPDKKNVPSNDSNTVETSPTSVSSLGNLQNLLDNAGSSQGLPKADLQYRLASIHARSVLDRAIKKESS